MTPPLAGSLFASVVALVAAAQAASAAEPGFAPVEVHVHPIDTFQIGETATRFGSLEFRGGITLSSADPAFGGWSGLDFSADGTLYAISDTGAWFTGRLSEREGRLVGVDDTMIAPLLGDDGEPLTAKRNADAEGLRITGRGGDEEALVSFEQKTAVRAFDGPDFARATPRRIPLPVFVDRIPANQGLESIAVAPSDGPFAGATVVIAEHSLDRKHNHRAFVLDGPREGPFYIVRLGDFDVSDAAFLPNGDLLILERRFALSSGFAMRLRRIDGSTIRPGATVDGQVLIEADGRYRIDNMEGLAVRTGDDGETLLDLISDDNHNFLQRTIVLQFALKPAQPPLPRLRPSAPAPP